MKNKELIITLIVILFIIVIGLIALLTLVLSGKLNFKTGFRNFGNKSNQIIFDTNYEIENIEDIEILSTAGDIKFEESMEKNIRVVAYGKNEDDLKVSFNENKLKIDYSKTKKVNFGFNFDITDIIIYIPKDYSKQINIKANYGDIELLDLENASIDISQDCGDVKLGKVKNISVKNSYGDIDIEEVLNKCIIESDCGDIKIEKLQIQENSSIESDLGDIRIKQTNDIYIDAKTDLGDVKVNTNNRHSEVILKIEGDCGDIKVGD